MLSSLFTDFNVQMVMLIKIVVAMLLGGLLGFERERADKPAGLRTHMFVAGTSAFLVLLGDTIITQFDTNEADGVIRADPIRIIQAIIVGISFLGTGTIIQREGKQQVEGLTTAATVLFSAALGIAVAVEYYVIAFSATLLALFLSWGVLTLEASLKKHDDR